MSKKVIAICGSQGAGKDTTADRIIKIATEQGLKVGKIAFADRLKDIAISTF